MPSLGYPQLCGGAERILSQRLRAGLGLQLLQGLKKQSHHDPRCIKDNQILLQVYTVVDEMFLAGEIRETSQTKVSFGLILTNITQHIKIRF